MHVIISFLHDEYKTWLVYCFSNIKKDQPMNDRYKDYKTCNNHAPKNKTNWQRFPTQTWFHSGIWNISKNVEEIILIIKVANYPY